LAIKFELVPIQGSEEALKVRGKISVQGYPSFYGVNLSLGLVWGPWCSGYRRRFCYFTV